jgi:hypothetical protein
MFPGFDLRILFSWFGTASTNVPVASENLVKARIPGGFGVSRVRFAYFSFSSFGTGADGLPCVACGWSLTRRRERLLRCGLGDAFLREFWIRSFGECPPQLVPAEVSCEEQNENGDCKPDIIVRGPSWRIVIEVKIDSIEHVYLTYQNRREGLPPITTLTEPVRFIPLLALLWRAGHGTRQSISR